ncbi:MAG: LysR family transcriptional regulator, partial [Myxococcota bacterium]
AAFTRACCRIRPILLADDISLNLERDTDIALRATTQPLDNAIGRNLCGLAWARYASVDTSGDDLQWIH